MMMVIQLNFDWVTVINGRLQQRQVDQFATSECAGTPKMKQICTFVVSNVA